MATMTLKKNYKSFQSLHQFYTGGPYAVSSDGSFLVCACDDTIKIVDSSNASIKSTIEGDSESITALTLSPNNNILFSTSHSRQIRVWDLSTLKELRSWKGQGHEGPVMGMACDASGGLLATAGADGKVLVWNVDGGFITHYFTDHKGVVTSILFHPNPMIHPESKKLLLFSGSDDSTIRVWYGNKKCAATLQKHQSAVTSMALSADGWTLLSAGRDNVVNLWNLHDYSCKITIPTYEALESICFIGPDSPFASYLASSTKISKKNSVSQAIYFITVGERGIVRIWNSNGSMCVFEQKSSDVTVSLEKDQAKRGFISAVMLPPDQGLLCVTADQQFFFYYPEDDSEELLNLTLRKRLIGYNEEIADMKFLGEDEQYLAVATSVEQVRVYDLTSMSCSYVLTGHTDIVLCLDTCVTSSGRVLIVTGSKDNTVRLWDSKSQSCIGLGTGHVGAIGAIGLSKKNHNFFVSGSSDRTLKVWSLDGVSDDNTSEITPLKSKAVVAAHDKDINSLAVSPNDSLVCSASQDRTACIWSLPDLVCKHKLKGHKRGIWSVEFSPVDQCVITASGDKTIKIWAISDGSCLKTFEGHTAGVIRASFITRGTQIVSSGADGLVKLWTVKTNECIATYDEHEDKIWALAIGKKTEMLATGGGDAVIKMWHDSTALDKEEAFQKEEEGVLKGQELENAILYADYLKAIQLAFGLRRPHKLFEVFSDLYRKKDGIIDDHITEALSALGEEEMRVVLEYVREWNTKPKLCQVAQFVLFKMLTTISPTEFIEIKGIGEVFEAIISYTQRHFNRMIKLQTSTFLLDYTLSRMSVLDPETDNGKTSTKKRKSHKTKDVSHKKAKAAA